MKVYHYYLSILPAVIYMSRLSRKKAPKLIVERQLWWLCTLNGSSIRGFQLVILLSLLPTIFKLVDQIAYLHYICNADTYFICILIICTLFVLKQVELLRQMLSSRYPQMEIRSVDGFQGRYMKYLLSTFFECHDNDIDIFCEFH